MTRRLVRLSDEGADDPREVGGKAAGLARLVRLGALVPPACVVTTRAYAAALSDGRLGSEVRRLGRCMADPERRQLAGRSVRRRFAELRLPPGDTAAMLDAARELSGSDRAVVAVRSSATVEDGSSASFAGQLHSVIGARGRLGIESAVIACWSSLFSPSSIEYLARSGRRIEGVSVAVVIQAVVAATCSGVLMTVDPRTGDRSQLVVEATYGLGSPLMSGEIDPDRYCIDKVTLQPRSRVVGAKQLVMEAAVDGAGLIERRPPESARATPCLVDQRLRMVAELGVWVERELGAPQDVEWAWGRVGRAEGLFVLQARPITGLPAPLGGAGAIGGTWARSKLGGPPMGPPIGRSSSRSVWVARRARRSGEA